MPTTTAATVTNYHACVCLDFFVLLHFIQISYRAVFTFISRRHRFAIRNRNQLEGSSRGIHIGMQCIYKGIYLLLFCIYIYSHIYLCCGPTMTGRQRGDSQQKCLLCVLCSLLCQFSTADGEYLCFVWFYEKRNN